MATYLINSSYVTEGQIGFIIERSPSLTQDGPSLVGLGRPAHTNQSHEPRLEGWCGTTNGIAVHAHGVGCVMQVYKNGRAKVVRLRGAEERAALAELGYPDLT
jgi:hypothetical protein